ncbi:MAG: 16S rRNA (cytidine(1402)-2'-O)-methyltransferase [Candidatus Auribacterota bacterium]
MPSGEGTLYIVATPIGNLADITFRALDVLRSVDLCLAEDTRHSRILFDKYGISTPMRSCYRHNEKNRVDPVISDLSAGKKIALISDAGTPGISDPGERLIRDAIAAGIRVEAIPGACSPVQALLLSGMRLDRFAFEGFIPRKGNKRNSRLRDIADQPGSVVLFESAMRLEALCEDLLELCGDRQMAVCRELTKQFEETVRGSVSDIRDRIKTGSLTLKGEFVIVIEGNESYSKLHKKAHRNKYDDEYDD